MRQAPPKRTLRQPAARRSSMVETDADEPSAGDAEDVEAAHRSDKRGRPGQSASKATYEIGRGRPPKHSQFKPGQSGNPQGRSPQTRNFKTMVAKVVDEQVQLREGGKVRRMPKIEALFRTVMSRAFKGDPKYMTSFLVMLKHSGYGAEATEVGAELLRGVDQKPSSRGTWSAWGSRSQQEAILQLMSLPNAIALSKRGRHDRGRGLIWRFPGAETNCCSNPGY